MKKLLASLGCLGCLGAMTGIGEAKTPLSFENKVSVPVISSWASALQHGESLTRKTSLRAQMKGAQMLLRAHRLSPSKFRSLVAASRACMLMGFATTQPHKMKSWGERGLRYSKALTRGWPQRAEGYLWSAIHMGLVAQGSNPMHVFFQGLHIKLEKLAKASIQRDNTLYLGMAHRILGRYYFQLPWPMRQMKRSLTHLRTAYSLHPDDANGLLFYADALWANGQKQRALRLFRRCSQLPLTISKSFQHPAQIPPHSAIAQCKKQLRKYSPHAR